MDKRIKKFAETLVDYSARVKTGEIVIIELIDEVPMVLAEALIDQVYQAGGKPVVWLEKDAIVRKILWQANKDIIDLYAQPQLDIMKKAAAYIAVRAPVNMNEMVDVPLTKEVLYLKHWWNPVHEKERVKNTKWVITRWPTPSMAQKAEMSTAAFEDFFFNVCVDVDYEKMSLAMDPLVDLMKKTKEVKIVGPGTDLAFSIKNIPAIKCPGEYNIPDGEVFTAPVKESVNGFVTFNTPTIYECKSFSDICLVFDKGKIVEAKCGKGDPKALNEILDTDEGARYIGEFALGLNPKITKSMGEILFDEKIAKSFHFTPGSCYDEAPNGNESNVHWDLVCIQSEELGGGDIYFDDVLVRHNGIFILPELKNLNP